MFAYPTTIPQTTPPSPPSAVLFRGVPSSPRRRTSSAKSPTSPSSDLSFPPSPSFSDNDHSHSEDYWAHLISPLVKQTTHRKQDYGTILSVLLAINSSHPPIIKTVEEAEEVAREVGIWFIVRGSERSVVKLGIGANPGLKKYYWRAESSKRLLKREMDQDPGHASLVYIIQKATPVSKRCASIPGTDLWLVMYLPATLRAAEAFATGAPSPARKVEGPTRTIVVPTSSSSAVSTSSSSSSSSSESALSSDESSDDDVASRKRTRRPTTRSPSPKSPIANPQDFKSEVTPSQDSAKDVTPDSPKRLCSRKSTGPSAKSNPVVDDVQAPAPLPYDINPTGDFFDSCIVAETCPPFFLDGPSFDNPLEFPLYSPLEADPFLPLAGTQTIFSAAIEAACMSGHRASWMNPSTLFGLPSDLLLSDFTY